MLSNRKGSVAGLILLAVIIIGCLMLLFNTLGQGIDHTNRSAFTEHENDSFDQAQDISLSVIETGMILPVALIGLGLVVAVLAFKGGY